MYRDTKEEAARLKVSSKTLENWRTAGKGPPFFKIGGRVRYDEKLTDQWVASCQRRSTSQKPAA